MVNKGINVASLPTKWCRIAVINSFKLNLQFDLFIWAYNYLEPNKKEGHKNHHHLFHLHLCRIQGSSEVNFAGSILFVSSFKVHLYIPETNSKFAPENRPKPNRKVVFQPSIFRGYVSFREGIHSIGCWSKTVVARSIKLDLMSQKLKRSDGKDSLMINLTAAFLGWICS